MTDSCDFIRRVEGELLTTGVVASSSCEAFAQLPVTVRAAFARAMRFVGCDSAETPPEYTTAIADTDRVRAARLMLLSLRVDIGTPAWSSWMIDRLTEAVMDTPGGNIADLLRAFYDLLDELQSDFTDSIQNLIKTLVIKSFTSYRGSYDAADLQWMAQQTIAHSTPAQAYLALHAVPPGVMQPKVALAILRNLARTPYLTEALNSLSDDLNTAEGQRLLREWLAETPEDACAQDIRRLLAGS